VRSSARRRSASVRVIDRHGVRGTRHAVSGPGVPHTVVTIMLCRWSKLTKICAATPAVWPVHALPGVARPVTSAILPAAPARA
jgi:hypothetical protein